MLTILVPPGDRARQWQTRRTIPFISSASRIRVIGDDGRTDEAWRFPYGAYGEALGRSSIPRLSGTGGCSDAGNVAGLLARAWLRHACRATAWSRRSDGAGQLRGGPGRGRSGYDRRRG